MKRALLSSLAFLIILPGFSQFSHGPILGIGYGFNGFTPDSLNLFVQSYNTYYEVGMKDPLPEYNFSNMHGINVSVGYRYMKRKKSSFSGLILYQYGYSSNTKRSKIWSNLGNELNLAFNTHEILLEGGYQIKGFFYMHALFGGIIRDVGIKSYTVYPDGSRSIGKEYDINGYYSGTSTTIQVGGSLGFRVWHFFFPIRVHYGFPLTDGVPLVDYNADRFRQHEFPKDYVVFVSDVNGTQFETNNIPIESFSGLRLQFGVEFMLPFFKK